MDEDEQPKFRSVAYLDDMFVDGPVDKDEFGASDVVRAIGGVEIDSMMAPGLDWGVSEMDSMQSFSSGFQSDFAGCNASDNNSFGLSGMGFTSDITAKGGLGSALPLPFDPTAFGLPPLDSMKSESNYNKTSSWDARFSMDDYGAHSLSSQHCNEPSELRPFPLHHQKYHSFYTSFSVCDVVAELDRVFKKASSLDYSLDSRKHKFKGVVREGAGENARFWFVVKLFKGRNPGEILVEMQKRGGCCVGFNAFYKSTVAQLAPFVLRRGCVCEGEDKNLSAWLESAAEASKHCSIYNLQAFKNVEVGDEPDQTTDCCELLGSALEMLQSDAAHKEHRLGINLMSTMASNDPLFLKHLNDAIAEREDFCLAKALQRSFDNQSNFVADDTCTLVASICEQACCSTACDGQKELRNDIVSSLLHPLFTVLDAPSKPGDVEIAHGKREVVRALASLPQDCMGVVLCEKDKQRCTEALEQLLLECQLSENDAKEKLGKVNKTDRSLNDKYQNDIRRARAQICELNC